MCLDEWETALQSHLEANLGCNLEPSTGKNVLGF